MSWFIFILGIALGAGGYYLYDKFSAKAVALTEYELGVMRGLEQKAVGAEKELLAKLKGWF